MVKTGVPEPVLSVLCSSTMSHTFYTWSAYASCTHTRQPLSVVGVHITRLVQQHLWAEHLYCWLRSRVLRNLCSVNLGQSLAIDSVSSSSVWLSPAPMQSFHLFKALPCSSFTLSQRWAANITPDLPSRATGPAKWSLICPRLHSEWGNQTRDWLP